MLEEVTTRTFCIMVYRGDKNIFFPENSWAINVIKFNVAVLNVKFNRNEMFVGGIDSWLKEKYI